MQGDGEFGALLRAFREQVSPERAGIDPTWPPARRVPGLRRDELARLASVSKEHLKRLEQGRRRPSRAVVDALARALRLDPNGHARFRLAAGFSAPGRGLSLQSVAPEAPQGGLFLVEEQFVNDAAPAWLVPLRNPGHRSRPGSTGQPST
jgi:transcriptional regulator with XRE-family HTH domain